MNKDKVWISTPHLGGNEIKYIQEAMDANWVSSVGENISAFEQSLNNYLGQGKYAAALNSGTSAIHLGLIILGVQTGDEVICQSLTFVASANPILYLGATPVFVDSEQQTWNLCPVFLEQAIVDRIKEGKKPKAIIAVHLYGMPYQVDEVRKVADKYKIPILEDSAEALGSKYKGQQCGVFGDVSVFSFNGSKIITTSGGGALISSCKKINEQTLFLATQSKNKAAHYEHSEIGYNYRMSNIAAGIGRGQMEVLGERIRLRREVHDFYVDLFGAIKGVTVFSSVNNDFFSNYWLTTILVDPKKSKGISREDIRVALAFENIEARPIMKPMHLQPLFDKYPYYGKNKAEMIYESGLCLPSGSNLTMDEKNRIKNVISSLFLVPL